MSSDTKETALLHLLVTVDALLKDFTWSSTDIDALIQIADTIARLLHRISREQQQ